VDQREATSLKPEVAESPTWGPRWFRLTTKLTEKGKEEGGFHRRGTEFKGLSGAAETGAYLNDRRNTAKE